EEVREEQVEVVLVLRLHDEVVPALVPEMDVALVVDLRPEPLLSEELDVQVPDLLPAHAFPRYQLAALTLLIIKTASMVTRRRARRGAYRRIASSSGLSDPDLCMNSKHRDFLLRCRPPGVTRSEPARRHRTAR